MDVERILKNVISKGKVYLGVKQTKAAIQNESAKLIIIANNCPYEADITKMGKEKKIPIYSTEMSSVNLGYAVGKNFAVSVFAVLDDGDANVLQLVKKRKS